jgi:hypothetical protein
MDLEEDFKEFLELLTANDVRYLIVGGFALAAHGRPQDLVDLMKLVRQAQRE